MLPRLVPQRYLQIHTFASSSGCEELVSQAGGVGAFMGWSGPTLTDSGGYQVFSLAQQVKVTDHGATFRSHLDGSLVDLTPEKSVAIQELLGADIAMQLDHVIGLPASRNDVSESMERSLTWGERCLKARQQSDQAMFGIVQGGLDPELRAVSAQYLRSLPFEGFAVGGLSVGERSVGRWLRLFRQQFHIYQRTSRVILWGW